MSYGVNIVKPTPGLINITLPYEEAEVLAQILQLTRYNELSVVAPELNLITQRLLAEFDSPASDFLVTVNERAQQVIIAVSTPE